MTQQPTLRWDAFLAERGGDDFDGNNDYDKNKGDDNDGHENTTMTKMTMMMTMWLDAFLAGGGGLHFSFYYTPHSIAAKTMDLHPPRSSIVVPPLSTFPRHSDLFWLVVVYKIIDRQPSKATK